MKRGSKKNRLMDFWLGIPLLNLLASFRRRRGWPVRVERIGVMCSPALGDTLLFSAVLGDLRVRFPRARIVHFCMRQNLAAAEIIVGADERVVIDLTRPWTAVRVIRQQTLDVMLDFSSWQRLTAFLTMMSGARFTAGFDTPGQHRGRAYDRTMEHRNDRHELENFRSVLGMLEIPVGVEPAIVLPVAKAVEPFAGEEDLVVFHLWASGARSWLREWPEERWVELARGLDGGGTLFVISGAPSDMERMQPFRERMVEAGLRAELLAGTDGFVTLSRVLRRARLVVSVNTGVMHLAAVLGAPTLSLNGPTANGRWGPVGRCVEGIGPKDGSGGYLNLGFEFPSHPEDVMAKITVRQAAEAARALVARCGGAPRQRMG